jgi:hypothetical protein
VPINGIAQLDATSLCPASQSGSVNLTVQVKFPFFLSWTHDCTKEETRFQLKAATTGWIGVGFNDQAALASPETMTGTEFYLFNTSLGSRNGYLAKGGDNAEPLPTAVSMLGTPLVSYAGGEITALFARKWGAIAADHASLTAATGLYLLAARSPSASFSTQHRTDERYALRTRTVFFGQGSGGTPAPAAAGGPTNSCLKRATVANEQTVTLPNQQTVTIAWTIQCAAQTIAFTVVGNSRGWLAMGLNAVSGSMDGTDTYQLTIDAAGGAGSVRNGVAEGTDVTEQSVFAAKAAARAGDKMTVTFERPLKGDASMRDIAFGTPLFLYASARNASAALTSSHPSNARFWSAKAIELLCDKADPCEAGGTAAPTGAPPTTLGGTPAAPAANGTDPCASGKGFFVNNVSLALADANAVTLAYNVSCVDKTIDFNVSGKTTGWLAIGFNSDNLMPNTDTYQLGMVDGKFVVRNGHAEDRDIVEDNLLSGVSGELVNGVLTGRFKRKLDTGSDKDQVLSYAKPLYLLVASGTTADFAAKHNLKKASGSAVQLFSTVAADTGGSGGNAGASLQIAHGVLMLLAWVALATPSMFIARFLKDLGRPWYLLHRALLNIVLLFTLVGFVLITIERALVKGNYGTPHSYIGIVIVIMTIVQVVFGVLSNRLWSPERVGTPVYPDMIHWWLGRALLLGGAGNAAYGTYVIASGFQAGLIICIVWIAAVVGFFVAGQIVIGAVHHNADSEKDPAKPLLVRRWRNLTFAMIVVGVIAAIASGVVAGSTSIAPF